MCYKRLNRAQKDAAQDIKKIVASYIFLKIFYFKYKVWMLLTFQLAPINI